jgi:hypothetical protein
MLGPVGITIEHVLQIGIVALVAGALVVDCVGEEGVETEADQEGLADLVGRGSTSELE